MTPSKLSPLRRQCQSVGYASERWAFIDGEIVAYEVDGRPSFNVSQNHRSAGSELHFYAFDLLTLRGKDLTRASLEKRRELLRAKVMSRLPDSIRYSDRLEASPADLIEAVREQGFEGIVANSPW